MANCPNCYKSMTTQTVEAHFIARPVDIDACTPCRLFWFDQWESTTLAPRSVLNLFQYIGSATRETPTPLASRFNCTRCQSVLDFTRDLQRTTTFTYWRCSFGHGRLISFHQFLREKNFIRTPSPAELVRLRQTVKQISCSQCGGPIDLDKDSACSHCGAPIGLVDPDGVAKAIHDLNTPQGGAASMSAADATRQALIDAHLDALFNEERVRERAGKHDLLVVGMEAIGTLVRDFLLAR